MSDDMARVADRLAIQDLMATYAQGVDRRDWAAVRNTFHPDASDDHGDYKGGVDGFIDWVSQRHAGIEQSMHFLGNCRIEFATETRAVVETYYFVRQRSPGDVLLGGDRAAGEVDVEIFGRYIDIVEKRDGAWRTARRTVAFEGMRHWPWQGTPIPDGWARASRDGDDPLHAVRRAAGL